ncbi:MAG: response regulator [Litorilituus sp.]|jgi:two-component system chemotaxis response regulator CheY|nr:response regulator [Litorilituus sp.]
MSFEPQLKKNSNIIVIDDEKSIVDFAALILQELGFIKVSAFTSIKEFMESNLVFSADLIFIDINLQGTNGLTLLTWIKVKRPSTTVVMFSGDTRKEHVSEAKMLGATSFLSKLEFDKNVRELLNKWNVNYPLD